VAPTGIFKVSEAAMVEYEVPICSLCRSFTSISGNMSLDMLTNYPTKEFTRLYWLLGISMKG
jgi:hypothetical protein